MPALGTVAFVSTHADSNTPTCVGGGTWLLKVPDSAETVAAGSTTLVDLHQTIDIPSGYVGLISGVDEADLTGAANCYPLPQIIVGGGGATALKIRVGNPSGSGAAPTANTNIAKLAIIKNPDYTFTTPGTY